MYVAKGQAVYIYTFLKLCLYKVGEKSPLSTFCPFCPYIHTLAPQNCTCWHISLPSCDSRTGGLPLVQGCISILSSLALDQDTPEFNISSTMKPAVCGYGCGGLAPCKQSLLGFCGIAWLARVPRWLWLCNCNGIVPK